MDNFLLILILIIFGIGFLVLHALHSFLSDLWDERAGKHLGHRLQDAQDRGLVVCWPKKPGTPNRAAAYSPTGGYEEYYRVGRWPLRLSILIGLVVILIVVGVPMLLLINL